jgi:hypothetical protein
VGAIAGALIGMGIPKDEAEWYEQEVRGGRTLLTVAVVRPQALRHDCPWGTRRGRFGVA